MKIELSSDDGTSVILEEVAKLIEERAKALIDYTDPESLMGYDNDILCIYFSLKQGGYYDK